MKRAYIVLIAFCLSMTAFAQKGSTLELGIIPADYPQNFPEIAKTQITNKLRHVLATNGLSSTDKFCNFFITVVATPIDKYVIGSAPTQIAQTLDFTFYIADYNRQIVYSSYNLERKGVGNSETRSYMDAIKHISTKDPGMVSFIETGKIKIIDYFNKQAEKIFMQAKQLSKMHEYEKAFWLLVGIPTECDAYDQSIELGNEIFQEYIDYMCDVNLAKARSAWVSKQNSEAAEAAGEYLSYIYPEAKCYAESQELYEEIKAKILEDWHFEMKKYQDTVDIEMQKLETWKGIGVAFGEGQQPTTTNIGWLGR